MPSPVENSTELKHSKLENPLLALLIGLVLIANVYEGWFHMGLHNTDYSSEKRRLRDGNKLAKAEHRFGIVPGGQTHYPNGPAYILVPWMKLGFRDTNDLRWVPFLIAVLAEVFLLIAFYKLPIDFFRKAILILAGFLLFDQPGVKYWLGALHEHSYAFSIAIILIAFALLKITHAAVYLCAGFVAGWIGYDPIPSQLFALMGIAFVRSLTGPEAMRTKKALKSAMYTSGLFASGVILALLLHFVQNALYFRGLKIAYRDLFGAAATRMDMNIGQEMNPEYFDFIKSVTKENASRWHITIRMSEIFLEGGWVNKRRFAVMFFTTLITGFWWIMKARKHFVAFLRHFLIVIAMAILSSTAWIWAMPLHAYHHAHFLPRLFFVPLFVLVISVPLLTYFPHQSASNRLPTGSS